MNGRRIGHFHNCLACMLGGPIRALEPIPDKGREYPRQGRCSTARYSAKSQGRWDVARRATHSMMEPYWVSLRERSQGGTRDLQRAQSNPLHLSRGVQLPGPAATQIMKVVCAYRLRHAVRMRCRDDTGQPTIPLTHVTQSRVRNAITAIYPVKKILNRIWKILSGRGRSDSLSYTHPLLT